MVDGRGHWVRHEACAWGFNCIPIPVKCASSKQAHRAKGMHGTDVNLNESSKLLKT